MIRYYRWALVVVAVVGCSMPATARLDARPPRAYYGTRTQAPRTREYAFTYTYFDYGELLPAPFKSTETGWIPGFRYTTENRTGNTRQRVTAQIGIGNTAYDGSLQNGAPYKTTTKNFFLTAELDSGRVRAARNRPFSLMPYSGIGLKVWQRDSSDDPAGYKERYGWIYVPLGVTMELVNSESVSVAVDASVRQTIYGWITVADAASGSLGAKRGYRLEVPITWHISRDRDFRIRPFYDYFESGRGNVFYQGFLLGYEPDSVTRQYGADLSLEFKF